VSDAQSIKKNKMFHIICIYSTWNLVPIDSNFLHWNAETFCNMKQIHIKRPERQCRKYTAERTFADGKDTIILKKPTWKTDRWLGG